MTSLRTRMLLRIWGATATLFLLVLGAVFFQARSRLILDLEDEARLEARHQARSLESSLDRGILLAGVLVDEWEAHGGGRLPELALRLSKQTSGTLEVFGREPKVHFRASAGSLERLPSLAFPKESPSRGWRGPAPDLRGHGLSTQYVIPLRNQGWVAFELRLDEYFLKRGFEGSHLVIESPHYSGYIKSGERAVRPLKTVSRSSYRGLANATDPENDQPCWLVWESVGHGGLKLGASFLLNEEMAKLRQLELKIASLAGSGLLGLLFLLHGLAGSILGPVADLSATIEQVGDGRFGHRVAVPSRAPAEIQQLALAFNEMSSQLQWHLAELERTVAEKERVRRELEIASEVQSSLLPRRLPKVGVEVCAFSEPATEVGGDFYDCFQLGDGRVGLIIGDVSGKGTPAALYMAVCLTLLRRAAHAGRSPADCLSTVNEILCEDLETGLFATTLVGTLDPKRRTFAYSLAGHPGPYRLGGGQVEQMRVRTGLPLGLFSGEYSQTVLSLRPGDRLVMITDGVTEARDGARNLYSEERLTALLAGHLGRSTEELLSGLKEDIAKFRGREQQNDDVTVLMVGL